MEEDVGCAALSVFGLLPRWWGQLGGSVSERMRVLCAVENQQ